MEPSIFATSVNLGAEIARTGSAEPNLTRQHFMNTLYATGRLLTRTELLKKFYDIPLSDYDRVSPAWQKQPFWGDPAHLHRESVNHGAELENSIDAIF